MPETWIALAFFICLVGASLGTLFLHLRLPHWHSAPETRDVRGKLLSYVKQAAARMAQDEGMVASLAAEQLLDDVAGGLRALQPASADQTALRLAAERQFAAIFEMRWALIEQSEGTIPMPLIVLLGAWLGLIFASFGYCAPRNPVVMGTLVISSLLIAGAIYLILDMDGPFGGPIQVSSRPLERALAEMQR